MPKRIVILGWYGNQNLGDELILYCMTHDIRQSIHDADITVISNDPKYTKAVQQVKAIKFNDFFLLIPLLFSTDLCVLGGGGLLKDGSCLKWLSYLTLFKLFGAKTMCYAVGVRELRSHLDSIITRVVLNHFLDLITVRDGYSEQILRDLGVKAKIVVTADAAISSTPLKTLKKNQIEDILEKRERPLIGVCLRQFEHEDLKDIQSFMKYEEYLAKIAFELDEVIIENGGTLIMIPSMISKFESDLKDILGVYSKMINKKKLFLIRRQVKPQEFHRIISLLDLVISQRLHPLIIASLANVPIIALPYAPKVRAHMEEVGLLDQCIDYNLLGHKILTKIVHTSLLNKEDLIKTLEKRTKYLYRRGKMNLSLMKMLLNNGQKTSY